MSDPSGAADRPLVPVVLGFVGLVWIGQGVGLLRGSSFMVDDPRWAVIGVVLVVACVALMWRRRRLQG